MMSYKLADDPAPTSLNRFAVRPMWILIAYGACGPWLSWSWFAFNAYATGSPNRQRQLRDVVIGYLVMTIAVGIAWVAVDFLPQGSGAYLGICLLALKFAITVWHYQRQLEHFEIYEYFEGKVMRGWPPIAAGVMLAGPVLGNLPDFWKVILLGFGGAL